MSDAAEWVTGVVSWPGTTRAGGFFTFSPAKALAFGGTMLALTAMQRASRSLNSDQRAGGIFDADDDATNRAEEIFDGGIRGDLDELFRSLTPPAAPFAVAVQALDTMTTLGVPVRVGLAWDGATVLEAPAVPIPAGTTAVFRVSSTKGRKLEVWSDAAKFLVNARVTSLRDADVTEKTQEVGQAAPPPGELARTTVKTVVGGAVVVGVIALILRRFGL